MTELAEINSDLFDEVHRLKAEVSRWERWSKLDRPDDSFETFRLEKTKIRHQVANDEGTCDFQTMHNDRKCLIEYTETLLAKNKTSFESGYRFAYETHCTEIDEEHYAAMLKDDLTEYAKAVG